MLEMLRSLTRLDYILMLLGLLPPAVAGLRPPTAAAEPVTVSASADSYVDANVPSANFGTHTSMLVDASPNQIAYLTFDVPSRADVAAGVKLRIFAQSAHSTGVTAYGVAGSSWSETGITFDTRPPTGTASGTSGALAAATWEEIDVSSVVTSTGLVSLALQTTSDTSLRLASREGGANGPQLVIAGGITPPPPPPPTPATEFAVNPVAGGTYQAVSSTATYTGSLKSVGEQAVAALMSGGGGTVRFSAGTFDFGGEWFKLRNVSNIDFVGAGIDQTVIINHSTADADTEPFNFTGTNNFVKIREMTVIAGGTPRTTSDAIDVDGGSNTVIENVAITGSRARGIVFDGKDTGASADNNTIRGCRISGVPGAGIEILASSGNTITGCTITDTGTYGIQVRVSSTTAPQPNKKSSDNTISRNTIDQAGSDGVSVLSGDRNKILSNTITNSSDDVAGRDGIRISAASGGPTCDDNAVSGNRAIDNQAVKTQAYGLNINSPACNRTVVGTGNGFAGNKVGPVKNLGTSTEGL